MDDARRTMNAPPAEASTGVPTEAGTADWHVLVLPDREGAEELAEALVEEHGFASEPQVVREALAGEDDAEDAQWLVVVDSNDSRLDAEALAELARGYEGWLERE